MPQQSTSTNPPEKSEKLTRSQKASTSISAGSANEAIDGLTPNQQKVKVRLTELYATIGALLASANVYAGLVIARNAEARAEEVVRAARHSKEAWKWVERVANGNDMGTLIVGHGLMVWAILIQAGRLPGDVNTLAPFGYAEWQILAPPPGMQDGTDTSSGN